MENITWPQLLIIAGTGRNTGKTTLACNILRKFSRSNSIISIKITPHFHKNIQSGRVLHDTKNLYISEETAPPTGKDSSLMLGAGAAHSYFIMADDEHLEEAVLRIREHIPPESFIICESGGLRLHTRPGLFLVMTRELGYAVKPSSEKLLQLADRVITFNGEGIDFDSDTIEIKDNQWRIKQ